MRIEDEIRKRAEAAASVGRKAGELALEYFGNFDALTVKAKGPQDLVSEADGNVETAIREAISKAFPEDGIVGEEHEDVRGASPFTWVIDPIDGTSNFVRGLPAWTVVLACVLEDQTVVGVVNDPVHGQLFECTRGGGAFMNGRRIRVADADDFADGLVGIGTASRGPRNPAPRFIELLKGRGGEFVKYGSGALCLAQLAAGKLIGYFEDEMNSWDCIAALLLVEEAGGRVMEFGGERKSLGSGRVVAGTPGVCAAIMRLANQIDSEFAGTA